ILGELVAGVAHELNNPLTAILGYAQILESLEGAERDEAIRTIEVEAVRASRIVRNLLSFSRQRPPERRAVDVERILRRVIDLRRYALEVEDIQILPRFSHVPEVLADESQLEEAFLHLLVNAQQALERRGGQVTVTTTMQQDMVRIAFADSGGGIPEELRGRVFEPFFTTREVGSGQGMGLAIVHGVIAAHGGRAWAEAGPGGGAQIVLELPVMHEGSGPRGPVPLVAPQVH
ncbi:MAG: ATP-binding protein, partial [Chloroflexi bacterium]|nr:ATP-binding protein [Chloroflexota bacterium]